MITAAELQASTNWRRNAEHQDGKEWFADVHQSLDFPRLRVKDVQWRRERRQQRVYVVDGATECETLEQAAAALNHPPAFTPEEAELLARVPAAYVDVQTFRGNDRVTLILLSRKGAIDYSRNGDSRLVRRRAE